MKLSSGAGTAALKIAVSFCLLGVGTGGGAALGLLKGPAIAEAAVAVPAEGGLEAFDAASEFASAGLTVQEPPPAAPATVRTVRRVVTRQAAPKTGTAQAPGAPNLSISLPGSVDSPGAGGASSCSSARLDDAKINWLLNLVAEARESNPDQAAVADRVEAQLRSAMGKNMCADEAQAHISNMCADSSTKKFMGLMVKELPFFVRPLVGDPCTKDLVAAAEKYL